MMTSSRRVDKVEKPVEPNPPGGFAAVVDYMERPISGGISPGTRPNEYGNPELEVMARQVSPELNAQAAVEQILGKELADGVTPMPETLAQKIRAEINESF